MADFSTEGLNKMLAADRQQRTKEHLKQAVAETAAQAALRQEEERLRRVRAELRTGPVRELMRATVAAATAAGLPKVPLSVSERTPRPWLGGYKELRRPIGLGWVVLESLKGSEGTREVPSTPATPGYFLLDTAEVVEYLPVGRPDGYIKAVTSESDNLPRIVSGIRQFIGINNLNVTVR